MSDLVQAHVDAYYFLQDGGLKFTGNVGYGMGHSVLDVVNTVKRVSGVDFDVDYRPRRPGDIAAIVADSSRMQRRLDWHPEHTELEQIVETALAWEEKLQSMQTPVRASAPLVPDMDNLMDKITLI